MISLVWKLSALALFAASIAGCSSRDSKCSEEVATHPGMTCLDVGLGWYHAEFAQMPADQPSDHAVPPVPVASSLSTN